MSQEKPHKTSDPKISSHTSLFWTLSEQLSKLQRAFPQTCLEPMSQEKYKPSDPKISSHTSLFWTLSEQLSKLQRAFPQTCLEPMSQKNTKPQTPRFHLTHPCFQLYPNSSPSYTADYRPWMSCLQESYTTTHFCKAIHYGPKNKGPESGAPALGFQQHQQLVNGNLFLGLESRGLCREFPWPKLLRMKTRDPAFH